MNQWRKGLALRHLFHLWPSFDVCGNFQKFFRVLLSTLLRCAINISDRWPVHTLKSHAPKNCFVCCTKRPRRLFRAQQTCRCVSAIPSGRIINERIAPPAVLWQSAQNIRRDFFFSLITVRLTTEAIASSRPHSTAKLVDIDPICWENSGRMGADWEASRRINGGRFLYFCLMMEFKWNFMSTMSWFIRLIWIFLE